MFRRAKQEAQQPASEGIFEALRSQALSVGAASVGIAPSAELPRVYGVVMDRAYPEGLATLVAFADGTTSLYTSGGGGVIGGGEHASVAALNRQLLIAAEDHLERFSLRHQTELPNDGRVLITVLTYTGRFAAESSAEDLGEGRHAAAPVFYAAHEVIHALHMIEEGSTRGEGSGPPPTVATPLMAAAHQGDMAMARQLIERQDDLEARDDDGYTALMYAANAGHEEIVKTLLAAGADVNAADNQMSTPLMFAAQHDQLRIVHELLAAGANASARGTHGLTALGVAQQNGHHRVASILIAAGATE